MKYYIPDTGESLADAREVPGWERGSTEDFACAAAAYEHEQCDGWELSWPLNFTVIQDNGEEINLQVNRDFDPVFTVSRF